MGEHRYTTANRRRVASILACGWIWIFLILCLIPTGAAGQYFGKNKVQIENLQWKTLFTPHFEILHYAGAEELAVRASLIAEQAYTEYSDRLDHDIQTRIPFILYASHQDFSQTNIMDQLIGEGTGGFSEPFRNRMVLPYNGSHADFVHVIRHELVHVFMFDIAFGRSGGIGRSYFFQVPLWFAEGIAEWFSSGWDGTADMFMRDATINDYLYPLHMVGGFLVYKEGQAAMRLLSEVYGEQSIVEFWKRIGRTRNVDRALLQVYGLEIDDLNELFQKSLRKRYWPSYGDLEEAADIARQLTDHEEDPSYANDRPAISRDGNQIAFFSDRSGLNSLYLMSAIDGKILRRLGQGQRSSQFESFHSFRSDISFDPTGQEIVFIAKSGNHETLHTMNVKNGDVTRSLRLGLDVASSPAWSPDGGEIALVGTKHGRTDLYLIDLDGDFRADLLPSPPSAVALDQQCRMVRLTDDIGDEANPAWSLDGSRLAFAFNPRAELDFEFEVDADGNRKLLWARPREDGEESDAWRVAPGGSVVLLDLRSGQRIVLSDQAQGWHEPVWIDERTLCVVDDTNGISNLALVTLDSEGRTVIGHQVLTNVLGGIFHPSYASAADRLTFTAFQAAGFDVYTVENFQQEWAQRLPGGTTPAPVTLAPPPLVVRQSPPDTLRDVARIGSVEHYRPRFSVDMSQALGGGAIYFSSAVGLGMANIISLSDILGNHRLRFLVNFYGSLDNSDLAASYFYLKRRVNLGVGLFHYHNYYNSFMTSVGELLPNDTFFAERNYGLFALASYPFNTFQRLDLELQAMTSERTSFVPDTTGFFLLPGEKQSANIWQPSLSFVHDTALYGYFGPATGSRIALSFAPSLPITGSDLDRVTTTLDLRKYWQPFRRNTLAFRFVGAHGTGRDPRYFVLGGPFTLRGYEFYDYQNINHLSGANFVMANFEYRLPLVDYLIFGWPGRWGLSGIGATLFFDVGSAWTEKVVFFGRDEDGRWGFQDLHGDYGFGIRTSIGFIPLKFDWAWKTDFRNRLDGVFHFSIAPEF
ncbi:MAG: BamA/TamA family outer membrane protein [bacterium]